MAVSRFVALLAAVMAAVAAPGAAQIRTVDPSSAEVASDLAPVPQNEATYGTRMDAAPLDAPPEPQSYPEGPVQSLPPAARAPAATSADGQPKATYQHEEVFGAAERVFGKGAKGLAQIIENILSDQGEPNAYIAGREGGGAIGVGLRYGAGDLFHKIEGQRPVYWSGPSIGFDVGGNAAKTFVLVYNLYDSEDLYRRFPAAEGNVYVVGGFTASYLRRGDIVIIPIRLGVGWRVGANVGYMKFTHKAKILPF